MAFSILKNGLRLGKSLPKFSVAKTVRPDFRSNMVQRMEFLTPALFQQANSIIQRGLSSKAAKTRHNRKYQSSSESDSDLNEWIGRRGDTDFWRRKIRTFHSILDLNKDGVISFDDFKLLADRFVDLGHLSEKHTKGFYDVIQDLWVRQFGEMSPYNLVTVEKFLENMHHVLNDKRLVRRAHSFLPYLFKAVDKDHSGEITVEEFKLFFDVLGLDNEHAVLAFRAIDSNGDGRINSKEFVKHGRDFFLSEDEESLSKYFWGPLVEH